MTVKERGNANVLQPVYVGEVDEKFLIEFFGLNKPDVEWYKIDEMITCCLCGKEIAQKESHNPYPVSADGRCCTLCNYQKVLPARLTN